MQSSLPRSPTRNEGHGVFMVDVNAGNISFGD
jgi:hypothetical protein